jgi:multidrug efflux pump
MLVIYLACWSAPPWGLFKVVPGGFVPAQDKQYLIGFAQLPDGATLDRTEDVIRRMGEIVKTNPGVEDAIAFPGLSINGFTNSSNSGIVFVTLKPFAERTRADQSGGAIAMQLNQKFGSIQEPSSPCSRRHPWRAWAPPAASSCKSKTAPRWATKRTGRRREGLHGQGLPDAELAGLFSSYQVNVPQLYADIDRTKARQLGVPVTDIFDTCRSTWARCTPTTSTSSAAPTGARAGRCAFRAGPEDVARSRCARATGEMVPLSALVKVEPSFGPERAMRYNGYLRRRHQRRPAPGFSSGQARRRSSASRRRRRCPGITFEWTDLTYQKSWRATLHLLVFPLAMLLVFLVLAAQYESLTLPLAIILIVPMGLLAAMTGVWLTGATTTCSRRSGSWCWWAGGQERDPDRRVRASWSLQAARPVQAAIEPAACACAPS